VGFGKKLVLQSADSRIELVRKPHTGLLSSLLPNPTQKTSEVTVVKYLVPQNPVSQSQPVSVSLFGFEPNQQAQQF